MNRTDYVSKIMAHGLMRGDVISSGLRKMRIVRHPEHVTIDQRQLVRAYVEDIAPAWYDQGRVWQVVYDLNSPVDRLVGASTR